MTARNRILTALVSLSLVSIGALAGAAGAQASTPPDSLEPSSVLFPEVDAASGDTSRTPAEIAAKLERLSHVQTSAQIDEIVTSGEPAEILADSDGSYIAAYRVVPDRDKVISWTSPGCGAGDACITSAGKPFGYHGSGQLTVSLPRTTRLTAGAATTTAWSGTVGYFAAPKNAVTIPSVTITSITRSPAL